MIDLHNHLLHGLDDGPETLEDSLEMCRIGYRDGIRTIIATPHTLNGVYQNDRKTVLRRVQDLNAALSRSGILTLRPLPSALKVLPGADVHLAGDIMIHLAQGKLLTVGDGNKYILIEFPSLGIPYLAEKILFEFIARGIVPIITHPERNPEVGRKPARYVEMIRMGCLGQVTAMSLTGGFGPDVRRLAEELVLHRLVHVIASDGHSIKDRPPVLTPAVKAASRLVGEEEAWRMVNEHPGAILEGRRPTIRPPIPF